MKSHFSKIPDEVLMEMLFFLDLKDLHSLSVTCLKMQKIIDGNSSTKSKFWKFYFVLMFQEKIIFDDSKIEKKLLQFVEKNFKNDWKKALKYFLFAENIEKEKLEEKKCKIVFLGGIAPGKTSYSRHLQGKPFIENTEPTIGASFCKLRKKDMILEIWDTAGHESFNSLLKFYLRDTKLILLFYDITSTSSFFHYVKDLIRIIKDERKKSNVTDQIYLIGNKIDLKDRRRVFKTDVEKCKTESGCSFKHFETSIKTGEGLDELYSEMMYDLRKNFQPKKKKFSCIGIDRKIWKKVISSGFDKDILKGNLKKKKKLSLTTRFLRFFSGGIKRLYSIAEDE